MTQCAIIKNTANVELGGALRLTRFGAHRPVAPEVYNVVELTVAGELP